MLGTHEEGPGHRSGRALTDTSNLSTSSTRVDVYAPGPRAGPTASFVTPRPVPPGTEASISSSN